MPRVEEFGTAINGETLADRALRLDEEASRCYRASGDCECPVCHRPYREHPYTDHRAWDTDEHFLNKLCNGDIVKL